MKHQEILNNLDELIADYSRLYKTVETSSQVIYKTEVKYLILKKIDTLKKARKIIYDSTI